MGCSMIIKPVSVLVSFLIIWDAFELRQGCLKFQGTCGIIFCAGSYRIWDRLSRLWYRWGSCCCYWRSLTFISISPFAGILPAVEFFSQFTFLRKVCGSMPRRYRSLLHRHLNSQGTRHKQMKLINWVGIHQSLTRMLCISAMAAPSLLGCKSSGCKIIQTWLHREGRGR